MVFKVYTACLRIFEAVNYPHRNDHVLNSLVSLRLQVAREMHVALDGGICVDQFLEDSLVSLGTTRENKAYPVDHADEFLTLDCFISKLSLLKVLANLYTTLYVGSKA